MMLSQAFAAIKNVFSETAIPGKPRSASRDTLAKINAEIEAAREAAVSIERRIVHLKSTIEAGEQAGRELQISVGSAAGAAALAAFSGGRENRIARQVADAEHAAWAAAVARRALPVAENDLAAARAEIARLEDAKKAAIKTVLIEHGDLMARRYVAAFEELCAVHDQIVGFARGANVSNVILASTALEIPRFDLPKLKCADGFTTYLKHIPKNQDIHAASIAWSRFAARLADDPNATVSAELDAVLSSEVVSKTGRHPEHDTTVISWVRKRDEPAVTVDELLYGGDEPREWRVRTLA